MSRYGFDRLVKQLAATGELDEPDEGADGGVSQGVVLYGTSWCGACAAARRYFADRHVPFVDKDIEKDPKAEAELVRKARRAGISLRGVPVIDVRGTLMTGFDPGQIERLLKGA